MCGSVTHASQIPTLRRLIAQLLNKVLEECLIDVQGAALVALPLARTRVYMTLTIRTPAPVTIGPDLEVLQWYV